MGPKSTVPRGIFAPDDERLVTAAPLENQVTCQACHSSSQATLGVILVERSTIEAARRIDELRLAVYAGASVLFFVLFGSIWGVYEGLVGRPLRRLNQRVSLLAPLARPLPEPGRSLPADGANAKREIDDFARIAGQMEGLHAAAVEKTGLLDAQRADSNALLSLSEWIDVSQTKEKVLQFAVSKVQEVTGFSTVAMRLFNSDSRCFRLVAHNGMTPRMVEGLKCIPMDVGFFKDICATHRAACSTDLASDERLASRTPLEAGMRSLVCVPLVSGERIMGSMELVTKDAHLWTDDEIRWLELVGRSLGNGLHHIETTDRLRNLAVIQERSLLAQEMHDGLAQLLNTLRLWAENAQLALRGRYAGGRGINPEDRSGCSRRLDQSTR